MALTLIQNEIKRSLEAMGERSKFTDAQLAKKLRELCKLDGKKKAVLALADILAAMSDISDRYYRITVTNANDLLIERSEEPVEAEVTLEAKQRRQRHEKSQMLFTNGDVEVHGDAGSGNGTAGAGNAGKRKRHGYHRGEKGSGRSQRTERTSLNVNRDYTDE